MKKSLYVVFFVVLLAAAFIQFPSLDAPWQAGEIRLFDTVIHPLKNMTASETFEKAPGEFLGYWLLAFQARHAPSPYAFRLVNLLMLMLCLCLLFLSALAFSRSARSHPFALLFIFAALAFHPCVTELVTRSDARSVLAALALGSISTWFLILGLRSDKGSFLFIALGLIMYALAIVSHASAVFVIFALSCARMFGEEETLRLDPRKTAIVSSALLAAAAIYTFFAVKPMFSEAETISSFSFLGPGIILSSFWKGFMPFHMPGPLEPAALFAASFVFFLAGVFLYFSARDKASGEELSLADYIIMPASAALGFFSASLSIGSAYVLGMALSAMFLWTMTSMLLSAQALPVLKKSAAVVFQVLLVLLLAGTSYSHALAKKHDLSVSRSLVRAEPGNPQAWIELGRAYIKHSQPERAEKLLDQALVSLPELERNILLFRIELAKDNIFLAKGLLEEFLKDSLSGEEILFHECQLAAIQVNRPEANAACNKKYSDPTMTAAALNQFAAMLLKRDYLKDAREVLEKALDSDPLYPGALNNMGYTLEMRGMTDEALDYYRRAALYDPFSTLALKNAARVYHKKKQYETSVERMKRVIEINPYDADAYANIALMLLLDIRQPEQAKPYLMEALELAPASPRAEELNRLKDYYFPENL